ncbi:ABC transporter ATP-binding protein [Pseudoalteromonas luteoviolacea]|uniref:ABC transporter ATP-binding protein n=1 Tax=Pseudoalteromonas luteoviolacea TaxID=43657 RepID=UPI0031BA3A70|nr:ABC transporter ATP-binding protein [Pseudoalteromonas luteoviolacea]
MIEFKKLSKVFTTDTIETTALNELNFKVEKGDFVAVMGPSGSGKSTLLNIVGMIDSPSDGEYIFDGRDVTNLSESQLTDVRHQNIGFIFQSFNLIDELTVRENVELPLMYQKVSASERKKRSDEVLERLNIAHRANHLPQQLSGGQQQRVAVARALIIKPKLILADEPTGNLDSTNGAEVMELLTELNSEGTTVVMVTHSLEHASYAKKILSVKDGEIIKFEDNAAKLAS